ncbi:MAG: DeoR/GlpR transcriptional regulator [SAR324 cluster bacterium]|nr:DeoR/GlpR transcriptional regulator [SAR324 cluster bacterium]
MLPEQRHRQILDFVETHKQVKVNDLAQSLKVSKETIRRDLTSLEDRGLLRKVHGAAVYIQTAVETVFSKRQTAQREEKQKIANCTAEIFHEGDSIMIESGTTSDVFAAELAKKSGLTIITNSLAVANRVYHGVGVNEIFFLGGKYHGETTYTYGPLVIQQISSFMVDYAVLTVGAINVKQGIMYHYHEDASIATAMMQQARMTVVLADHTKFGRNALVPISRLNEVDILVTDLIPESEMNDALQRSQVKLITPES